MIQQTAGEVTITIFTDGWPRFPYLSFGSGEKSRLDVNTLHDLRYCIDRALAQLEAEDAKP